MAKTKAKEAGDAALTVQGGVKKHTKGMKKTKATKGHSSDLAPSKNARQQRIDKAKKRRKANVAGKQVFYAVRVGRQPGVYTSQVEYEAQVRGFTNASAKRFKNEAEARAFVADAAAAEADLWHLGQSSGIRFSQDMPRSFVLGMTRDGGRKATNLPKFGATHTVPDYLPDPDSPRRTRIGNRSSDEEPAPAVVAAEVGDEAGAEDATVQFDALDDVFGTQAPASAIGMQNQVHGASASVDVLAVDDSEGGGSDGKGALAGDFIALRTGTSGSEDGAEEAATLSAGALDITRTPAEAGGAAEAAKTEWRNHELPWYAANTRIGSPALRLHNEIVELTHLLQPTATEDAQRREAHALLAAVVQEVFPGCTLEIFGSFATGLHLPTSDVDTVILESAVPDGQVALALRGLGRKLQPLSWVKDLEVVDKAKVPIVKLIIMPYGLKFDVSIGKRNGLDAVALIRRHLAAWPALRPLVTILKLYLQQRGMNEVYTGGLGSYALIICAVAFLQLHQSRTAPLAARQPAAAAGALDQNLGVLLVDFFRFYGRGLAYKRVGITCANGGACYDKVAKGFGRQPRDRGDRLSVMDPLDTANDVARGAYNSFLVRNAFDHAYNMLVAPNEDRAKPMLGTILRLNEVLAIRPPPLPQPTLRQNKRRRRQR